MPIRAMNACIALWALALTAACSSDSSHDAGSVPASGGSGGTGAHDSGVSSGGTGTGGAGVGSGGAGISEASTSTGGACSRLGESTDAGAGDAASKIGDAGPSSSRQTARPLGSICGAPNGYYEYLPLGYDGHTPTPLLIFWHGHGAEGTGSLSDLPRVLVWGPPHLISQDRWDSARPFIVLTPQSMNVGPAVRSTCPSSDQVDAFLTWAVAHYPVDKKRVYLTGLSCGAIGVWDYVAKFHDAVVAAAVPLSGDPIDPTQSTSDWAQAGCALGSVAIWSFHGDLDATVPYAPDHDTMQNIIACPAPPRRDAVFTDVVGGGHNIWDPIYDLSGGHGDIYKWMLTNAKP